ncbi:protein kinase [candidate division KSB1 bacterium]|nr:protein kinase [candidate division KSB1 bacterium]
MIGQTISHYKILEKLGGGGMGVVYKAQDLKLDRFVALKFLPPHLSADEEEKKRFIHEAKAASALDHPNICTIYEIDETEDGQMFIAMAYYEGETLKKKVASGQLSVDSVIDLAIQIAQGLAKAHEKGIVHRDIKPANIFVTNDGIVKILDFGLAKLAGYARLTKPGTALGTTAYTSPEQTRGEEVDHRTDIWSLGVVLYEMLTGQLPFKGEYEQAVMYSIIHEEPKPLADLRAGVPTALERMVNKSIAKNADKRFQHINEMLADLSALKKQLESESIKESTSAKKPAPSIAVLPFSDLSPQKDQEYFCDGMAEELINALAKLEGLRVVSRSSGFQFKGQAYDIRKVGGQLNVSTVLEGSVRKAGNRLRITAQLVNVEDGYHLWSEKYDRELEDVFAIQDDITRTIVNTLKIKLISGQEAPLIKRYTENFEAYNLYLKGRYFWNKRYEGGLQQAVQYFNQALEKDPAYALAYSGLADCFIILGFYTYLPPKEAFPKAKALAQKALEIDDALSEAHTSLGFVKWAYDWDWLAAEQEFKRAIDLNPGYATAHLWYAVFLMPMGRTEESLAEIQRAQELDPLSLVINSSHGWLLHFARQHDKAVDQGLKTLEMDPNFSTVHIHLGWIYEQQSRYDEAIMEFQKGISLLGDDAFNVVPACTHAMSGRTDEARKILQEVSALSKERYVSRYFTAAVYVGLNEKDQAFEWLKKAYEERDGWLVFLKIDPRCDRLRSDPRFTDLLKKVGLRP